MANQKHARLASLDALRGFDMFWIVGGATIFRRLAQVTDSAFLNWIAQQTAHAQWDGFRFFDLIFPLFLFIAGVSFPFSLSSRIKKGHQKKQIVRHIIQRGLILVLLGIVYNGFFKTGFSGLRYASVLGRIGLAWMFAALIYMYAGRSWKIIWFISILMGYYAIMVLIPVPGYGSGDLTLEGNLATYIDSHFLPGKLYFGCLDPEGILSTLPAISTAILGMFTGQLLKSENKKLDDYKKFFIMLISGGILILLSLIWNISFPINKNLWSSSFVLCAGGISLILLSIFYLFLDIWKYQKWAYPFIIIGLNPITIYLGQKIIDFYSITDYFFGHFIHSISEIYNEVWMACGYLFISWLFLFFLHKKKIYLKV